MIKKIIKKIVGKLGYEVVKLDRTHVKVGFNSQYLASICTPDLVIDVGVGHGTYPLYQAFPDATFILVEPLAEEYSDSLKLIKLKYSCEVVAKALGVTQSVLEINFAPDNLEMASLFERTQLSRDIGRIKKKFVQVTTLDILLKDKELLNKSVFLKVDTEGGELSVLRGGMHALKQIEFVIAEVNVAKRFESSYEFEELIEFMTRNNFRVFSFLTMTFPNNEPRQRFTDILFKRNEKNSSR